MDGCLSVAQGIPTAADVFSREGSKAARLMSLACSAAYEMPGSVTIASVVIYSPAPPPKFARLGMTDDHSVSCGGTNGVANMLLKPAEDWEGSVNG